MTAATSLLDPPGPPCDPETLGADKARDLVTWLRSDAAAYVRFVECRRTESAEPRDVVVFDVEVELPQTLTRDIRRHERVAVTIDPDDNQAPEILALRADFPWVRHLNLRRDEYPRSLCVYEESYADVRMDWTSVGFVERIRRWLAGTAVDELHGPDQPLEAFLPLTSWSIVIPPDIAERALSDPLQPLPVVSVRGDDHRTVLMTMHTGTAVDDTAKAVPQVATIVVGTPQPHGVIPKLPSSLKEIHDFLISAEIDLLGTLRERLDAWARGGDRQLFDSHLIIIAVLPLTREEGGATEATSTMSFLCDAALRQVGAALGRWDADSPTLAVLLQPDVTGDGSGIPAMPLNTHVSLSAAGAARLSGLPGPDERSVVAVGLGALGSPVFDTLRRMGWGRWTLVDNDLLLPHNLARHELNANAVGYPKALTLAWSTTHTLCDTPVHGINADVLAPGDQEASLTDCFGTADVILDMSASIPVARALAHSVSSAARRASLFLNPSGTDSVLLVEDEQRTAPLDWLELVYYRALLSECGLKDHLRDRQGRVQYGHTCRDVSNVIPQDLVALHAALEARGLRAALDGPEATVTIWQIHDDGETVTRCNVAATPAMDYENNGWLVRSDQALLDKIQRAREARLPNETGGVLIGAYDMQRHTIYVVDLVPSPSDSTEWPTVYIRGCAGLEGQVREMSERTGHHLMYVGEWHSHPRGHSCHASSDDRHAFEWLRQYMALDGRPALMLIAGDNCFGWYVEAIA